tara:strand:- start:517 stop:825 length:309 start_codon:yes stop_codon:yes gene_type:complete
MKNKRHRGETNQGRSRDEQGGGVEVGCGDVVDMFWMVCWDGLLHEFVGGVLIYMVGIYCGDGERVSIRFVIILKINTLYTCVCLGSSYLFLLLVVSLYVSFF